MLTHVYLCLLFFSFVYLWFTRVYLRLPLYARESFLPIFTHIYSYLPMFTLGYLCLPPFTRFYSCLPIITSVTCACVPMLARVYQCLLVLTFVNHCLLVHV